MKLRFKIFLSLLLVLLLTTGAMVYFGAAAITEVVYDLNHKLLRKEMLTVFNQIESSYSTLKKHGLLGVRVYNDNAQQELLQGFVNYRAGEKGCLLIFSDSGRLLNDSEGLKAGGRELERLINQGHLAQTEGQLTLNLSDKKLFCVYQRFVPWQWLLVMAVDEKEILTGRVTYLRYVSFCALILLIVALALGLFLGNGLTRRLTQILRQVRRVESGDYQVTVSMVAADNDEIGELKQGIEQMVLQLGQRTGELEEARNRADRERSLLQSVIDAVPDMIFYKDREGVFLGGNQVLAGVIGRPLGKIIGKTDYDFFPPEVADSFRQRDLQVMAGGRALSNEEWITLADGGQRIYETVKSPFYDAHGALHGLVGVSRDITEAATLRRELKNSEAKYREIFNTPIDAIILHDAESGAVIDVNQGMLELFGYQYDEALTLDDRKLAAADDPEIFQRTRQLLAKAREEGPQVFDWLSRKKNGEPFWSEVSIAFREIDGQSRLVAVVRDISRRKAAEKALATERERLSVTLRSIGDGVISTDVGGRVTMINKVAEELTGWSQDEAAGLKLAEIFRVFDVKSGETVPDPVGQALSQDGIVSLPRRTLLYTRNGERLDIADSAAPIRDNESRIIGVVIVFRDVTESIKAEEEILKGRKLESIGVLAGGIAHDFNNILAALTGNLSLARSLVEKTGELDQLLEKSEKAAWRAQDLTQQLLTFARGGEPVKKVAAIEEIIRDSADFVLRGSNTSVSFNFADDLRPLEVDAGQISQVIQNIVINARQAMPEGGADRDCCRHLSS